MNTETETVSFAELVSGTEAERFDKEGYDIVDFEWVEGGLRIEAVSPPPASGEQRETDTGRDERPASEVEDA